jgi:predicted methyltransferase
LGLPNGVRLECDMNEYVQTQMWIRESYEPPETYLASHLVKLSMCVIDVGANVGQYTTLLGKMIQPNGRLHAFEPSLRIIGKLQTTSLGIDLNKSV